MLLVDTSAWIRHFRESDPIVVEAIRSRSLCCHELIVAELALGSVPDRQALISDLCCFPQLGTNTRDELLKFIEREKLFSTGIGFVDASLLLSVTIHGDAQLLTYDKRLRAQAERLGCNFKSH